MASKETLSLAELDNFFDRLRATVALAQEAAQMRAALSDFFGSQPAGSPLARGAAKARTAARTAAPAAGGGAKKASVKSVAKRAGKRGGLDAASVLKQIQGAPEGIAVSSLLATFKNASRPQMHLALQKLRDQGSIKLVGVKRAARWYPAKAS